jgi:hypothetical protein
MRAVSTSVRRAMHQTSLPLSSMAMLRVGTITGHLRHASTPSSPTATSSTASSSSVAANGNTFRILGLQQIAVGALKKAGLSKLWIEQVTRI